MSAYKLFTAVQGTMITFSTVAMPSFEDPPSDPSVDRFSCVLAIVVMKFCGAQSKKNGIEE
jgi:hypothetical protein